MRAKPRKGNSGRYLVADGQYYALDLRSARKEREEKKRHDSNKTASNKPGVIHLLIALKNYTPSSHYS